MAKRRSVKQAQRKVTYRPPAEKHIHQYVSAVCKELGETIDATFDTPEVRSELADFIKVIADIGSKQMNKRIQELDSGKAQR